MKRREHLKLVGEPGEAVPLAQARIIVSRAGYTAIGCDASQAAIAKEVSRRMSDALRPAADLGVEPCRSR